MDKYTLKTIFEKSFSGVIWRIEADTAHGVLAIESRTPGDGIPYFSAIRYATGQTQAFERPYGGRNWTLAGIRGEYIILRAFGEREPNAPGIACLSAITGEVLWESFNHAYLGMEADAIQARPRHIASGYQTYLNLHNGEPYTGTPAQHEHDSRQQLTLPQQTGDLPNFIEGYNIAGSAHRHTFGDKEAWAFHITENKGIAVKLLITHGHTVLEERLIMSGMEKMSPEIFFIIGRQLFFIDGNKQKIVSYLV